MLAAVRRSPMPLKVRIERVGSHHWRGYWSILSLGCGPQLRQQRVWSSLQIAELRFRLQARHPNSALKVTWTKLSEEEKDNLIVERMHLIQCVLNAFNMTFFRVIQLEHSTVAKFRRPIRFVESPQRKGDR
jgi:hypothetical protein